MDIESLSFNVLLVLAVVPLWALLGKSSTGQRVPNKAIAALWGGLAAMMVAIQMFWTEQPADGESAVANRPLQREADGYVGSDSCRSCHPHNHATWHDSYHRTMTQVASEESVLGDFNDVRMSGKDFQARLFKEGSRFMVEMQVEDPPLTTISPVVMTTGSHTRQAYWLESSPNSRSLTMFPYMYMCAEKQWIPRHSAYVGDLCLEERPELAVMRSDSGRWSVNCMRCHTTHGRPQPTGGAVPQVPGLPDPATATQAAEFGISCEACHGPGAAHARANSDPIRRYQQHLQGAADNTIVNPARLPHDLASHVCAQCHVVMINRDSDAFSRWQRHGNSYRPGDDLTADPNVYLFRGLLERMPDRPTNCPDPAEAQSFWPDGMIKASGREFNGLVESPCYQRGEMSCLSCHQMHQPRDEPRSRSEWANDQLKLHMEGNAACLQCHTRFNDEGLLVQHSHHAANSSGSSCYNCHMPHTTYGLLRAIRSHEISSPNAAVSQQTGRPNACNQCHLDKTLEWTADKLADWYQIPKPELSEEERQVAASVLWTLRGDAGQRALMAWSLGWSDALDASGRHWQAPYLAQLLDDRFDAVRYIALRSLKRLPAFEGFDYNFIGPPSDRAAAHQQALQIWKQSEQPSSAALMPAVLLDGRGNLLQAEFERLWRQRDDRAMRINE